MKEEGIIECYCIKKEEKGKGKLYLIVSSYQESEMTISLYESIRKTRHDGGLVLFSL